MVADWMRRIDTWFGGLLVALISRIVRAPRSFAGDQPISGAPPRKAPRTVIVAQFFGLGSVVLSLPMLKALRDSGAKVAFLSFRGQAEIVRLSGLADEVWVISPTLRGFLPTFVRCLRQARKFRAESFIDLERTFNLSALFGYFAGAAQRHGFIAYHLSRDRLFSSLVSLERERHLTESYFELLRVAGFRGGAASAAPSEIPRIPALNGVGNVLPRFSGRKRVVINIYSSDSGWQRGWELSSWVSLCDRLLEDRSVDLVFPGGRDEQERIQEVVSRLRDQTRVFNVAGTVSLLELLRIVSDAELVVSVCSGILHLAAWCGTPAVGLYGPESPKSSAPLSSTISVLWAALPCSPCFSSTGGRPVGCNDNRCMKVIDPELVYGLSRRALDIPRSAPPRAA